MTAPVLAFTGSRTGLTPAQREALRVVLAAYPGATLHNGCAEGADEEALGLVDTLPIEHVVLHPCNTARAVWARGWAHEWRLHGRQRFAAHMPMMAPLARNARMVAAASVVIACPDGPEKTRSGTWSTVRAARRMGRELVLVWPDGSISREGSRP